MAWKQLQPAGRYTHGGDRILVNARGYLRIGKRVYSAMGRPSHVSLHWDAEGGRLALRAAKPADVDVMPVMSQDTDRVVNAVWAFREIGVTPIRAWHAVRTDVELFTFGPFRTAEPAAPTVSAVREMLRRA